MSSEKKKPVLTQVQINELQKNVSTFQKNERIFLENEKKLNDFIAQLQDKIQKQNDQIATLQSQLSEILKQQKLRSDTHGHLSQPSSSSSDYKNPPPPPAAPGGMDTDVNQSMETDYPNLNNNSSKPADSKPPPIFISGITNYTKFASFLASHNAGNCARR